MMSEKPQKPNHVELWLFKGNDTYIGKSNGKVIGGIVTFPQADPTNPVIWLGQREYTLTNLRSRKTMLLYDTLSKRLFRPHDFSSTETANDMLVQAANNVLVGGKEAQQMMGIADNRSTLFNFTIGAMIVVAIVAMVFMYLLSTHSGGGSTATTTIAQVIGGGVLPKG